MRKTICQIRDTKYAILKRTVMKRLLVKHSYWIILACCFLFFVVGGHVHGQSTGSTTFTLTPALKELKVNPGYTGQFTLTLLNHSQAAVPFKVYTRNFLADGIDGKITFGDDDSSSYAAGDWLIPATDSILLNPGGEQQVSVAVSVPANAEPGGHYASVLFEQILPQGVASKNSQVQVATRMTALIYFTVSGDIVEAGQILGAKSGQACSAVVCGLEVQPFFDHGPIPFHFIFNNTGNIHVRPKGTITISQFGHEVAKIPVPDRAVLPNSQRKFTTTWDKGLVIGPYQAKLHLVYGSKNYELTAATTFWAFPWQIALGVALLALLIAAIILSRKYFRVKRLHHRK